MGYTKQFFEKTKAGTSAEKSKAWAILIAYVIGAYVGIIAVATFGVGGGLLVGALLLLETWESPSATVLFLDAILGFLALIAFTSERFRQSARDMTVRVWQNL